MSSSKYKTEICKKFEENGYCCYGDRCQFAHGKSELRYVQRKKSYKTVICVNYNNGYCAYGDRCAFAHDKAFTNKNKLNNNPKYKTKICKTFEEKGKCPYGDECIFIHKPKIINNKINIKNDFLNNYNKKKKKVVKEINKMNKIIDNKLKIIRTDSNEIYKKESRLFNIWLRKN